MYSAQQAPLPPALSALMQTAQMVDPNTRQPTVAGKVAQAAMERMQPQQAGIGSLIPGVKQQAMQMAQAAQPATQGDLQKAMMQRNSMQAGIGQLPGDIAPQGMAEGGVVGFAGDGAFGSSVPDMEAIALDELRIAEAKRKREQEVERQRLEFLTQYAPEVAATLRSQMSSAPAAQTTPPAPPVAPEARRLMDRDGPRIAPSPAPAGPGRAPSAQVSAPQAAASSGAMKMFEQALAAQGKIETPQERTAQQIRDEREAFLRSVGIDPDATKTRRQAIAEREAEDRAAAAARTKQLEGRGLDNLIGFLTRTGGAGSLFRGMAQASQGMEQVTAQQRKEDEAFRLQQRTFKIENEKERNALDDMQRLLAEGDILGATKSRDAALAARNAKNAAEAQLRGQFAQPMLQAETAAADRAQRASAEAARMQQQAEQNNQHKLANAIATNQSRLISAYKEVENILTKKYSNQIALFSMMSAEQLQKNPQLAESYNRYLVEKADLEMRVVKPIEAERNRLAAQVGGGGVTRYDAQGNRTR
jgi:hypothetical protein